MLIYSFALRRVTRRKLFPHIVFMCVYRGDTRSFSCAVADCDNILLITLVLV